MMKAARISLSSLGIPSFDLVFEFHGFRFQERNGFWIFNYRNEPPSLRRQQREQTVVIKGVDVESSASPVIFPPLLDRVLIP